MNTYTWTLTSLLLFFVNIIKKIKTFQKAYLKLLLSVCILINLSLALFITNLSNNTIFYLILQWYMQIRNN